MECSKGRYINLSFIGTAFLQVFLWEQFSNLAKPKVRVNGGACNFWALRWCGVKKSKNVKSVLDKEVEFCFHPYIADIDKFKMMINYCEDDRLINTIGNDYRQDSYQEMSLVFLSGYVLAMVEEAPSQSVNNVLSTVTYSPSLVAHKFGIKAYAHIFVVF
ncbi:hypothetical protein CFOL_v3_27782 [Cephalotus follicularis]|uniref:Uncharacterized protein n=1 Tax=Cephalotus follicularis TaxID=3775 RepID=A0A1Q3CW84_CEPFO|nr:hypothetical protein CFOL_v3_27782 [Cephalotus follicularis]